MRLVSHGAVERAGLAADLGLLLLLRGHRGAGGLVGLFRGLRNLCSLYLYRPYYDQISTTNPLYA